MNQLGKKRSKLGEFLDYHKITQSNAAGRAGVNKETMSRLCNDDSYIPAFRTVSKIMRVVREVDSGVKISDFFNF